MRQIEQNPRMSAVLTVEHWNIILMTLDDKPHRMVRPVIDALMEQLRPQSQPSPLSTEDVVDKLQPDTKQEVPDESNSRAG